MKINLTRPLAFLSRLPWGVLSLPMLFLLIEFFDELHYTVEGAVLPVLRTDLGLDYAQIGLLLGLPHIINTFIEPILMMLGDTRLRKRLVIGGGLVIVLAVLLMASAQSFLWVLLAFILAYPASGAFVSLSQASLMDAHPTREAQMMARWTVAGSIGNLLGPLAVAGVLTLGFSWRVSYLGLAVMAAVLIGLLLPRAFPRHTTSPAEDPAGDQDPPADKTALRLRLPGQRSIPLPGVIANLWTALRTPALLRWILLLEFSDLLLDTLAGYVPLYFTDVAGATPAQASLAFSVLLAGGLAADLALLPLLERFPGRKIVRASAALALVAYPAWLLVPSPAVKVALLLVLSFSTLGWYPVLKAETFQALPGRSGTVQAVDSAMGVLTGLMAWFIGWVASQAGLANAMWLLLLGPIVLLLFVPRATASKTEHPQPQDE